MFHLWSEIQYSYHHKYVCTSNYLYHFQQTLDTLAFASFLVLLMTSAIFSLGATAKRNEITLIYDTCLDVHEIEYKLVIQIFTI